MKLLSKIYIRLAALVVVAGTLLRIVLLFNEQTTDISFSAAQWLQIFLLGAINDLAALTIGFGFIALFAFCYGSGKYIKPTCYIVLAVFTALLAWVLFFNTIFDEYGSVVPRIAKILFGYIAITFALRIFYPTLRKKWAISAFSLLLFGAVMAEVFNFIASIVFWDEFGVRYNFIAVDYLVYTNEVIGNIMESYPIVPMVGGMIIIVAGIWWLLFRKQYNKVAEFDGWKWKAIALPLYVALFFGSVALLNFNTRFQEHTNVYVNELQANGCYKFCTAFLKNSLDFKQFYITLPDAQAQKAINSEYSSGKYNLHHCTPASTRNTYPNIIIISEESMSADFMARFGCTDNRTPNLDHYYTLGIGFDQLFATGNRTVRGLEALSLALPPCPGQSIIKRTENANMHTVAEILRQKGYSTTFFYGGDSYFDNMKQFFGGNGYEIVDKSCYTKEEITFANIWGVCDEDSFNKALSTLDAKASSGKPFFAHIMSVSNHRPYTYPDGKIEVPSNSKTRRGGVMYADYALGKFLADAQSKPWFDNTIFLITADHCASSAGSTDIPLQKYHIPALIYAPKIVDPQIVDKVVSQIDLIPTILSIAGIEYDSYMYGKDIFAPDYTERAFIATYQDLGYLQNDTLTVLSPVRKCRQFRIEPTTEDNYATTPLEKADNALVEKAVTYYQTSYYWTK